MRRIAFSLVAVVALAGVVTYMVPHVDTPMAGSTPGAPLRETVTVAADKPIPNVKYSITLPGGGVRSGTLDENGTARVEGIPAGSCQVSFPDLDQEAWVAVEETS